MLSEPSWPVFIAWSMSSASAPRTSPTMIRSGRMRNALRSELADRDLALTLDVLRPRLEPQHVRLIEPQLSRVLDRHDPLRFGDRAEDIAFSSVVLPEPVPPEMRMLSSALTARVEELLGLLA